jgi:hypothetical protein
MLASSRACQHQPCSVTAYKTKAARQNKSNRRPGSGSPLRPRPAAPTNPTQQWQWLTAA